MQKNEDIAGADFETLVTFSVLTPVVSPFKVVLS